MIAHHANVKPGMVSAIFWALLDHASQANERGNVDGFDIETYAIYSGFDEHDIEAVLEVMRIKGVINEGGRLVAWDKRQPKREDDSTGRVRAFRERKHSMKRNVTHGNAVQRSETQCNNTDKIREDKESIYVPTTTTIKDHTSKPVGGGGGGGSPSKTQTQPQAQQSIVVTIPESAEICAFYERRFGIISPLQREAFQQQLEIDSLEHILDALRETHKRRQAGQPITAPWPYAQAILERWRAHGIPPKTLKNGGFEIHDLSAFDSNRGNSRSDRRAPTPEEIAEWEAAGPNTGPPKESETT